MRWTVVIRKSAIAYVNCVNSFGSAALTTEANHVQAGRHCFGQFIFAVSHFVASSIPKTFAVGHDFSS